MSDALLDQSNQYPHDAAVPVDSLLSHRGVFTHRLELFGSEMERSVIDEAYELIDEGVRVEVIDVHDPKPDDLRRHTAREWIEAGEAMVQDGQKEQAHDLMYSFPSMRAWRERSLGTGLGIYTLYVAREARTLGDGIDTRVFTEKLFKDNEGKGISAVELLARQSGEEKAQEIHQQHLDVIHFPIDEKSRVIFSGSEDAVGIRVRSELAKEMALHAVAEHEKTQPLVLASLGAGSAVPAIKTMQYLEAHGYEVGAYHFVDADPMALAAAMSLVRNAGIDESKIRLHVENLLGSEFRSVEAGTADLVDAWGLAEYFPKRTAVQLLQGARAMLKDGGRFIFGNMLKDRAQKTYFEDIVQWRPKVKLRSLHESVELLEAAGYDDISVGIPSENDVYVGYAGRKESVGDRYRRGSSVILSIVE